MTTNSNILYIFIVYSLFLNELYSLKLLLPKVCRIIKCNKKI